MITVGMELELGQFKTLLAAPRTAILGTLIHTFSFPAVAATLVLLITGLELPVAEATLAGILLIAACPSGGFSNVLVLMARANLPLSIVLTVVSSVLAFASVPLLIAVFAFILNDLNRPVDLPVAATLVQLAVLILLPISLGMGLRHRWPQWIDRYLQRLQTHRSAAPLCRCCAPDRRKFQRCRSLRLRRTPLVNSTLCYQHVGVLSGRPLFQVRCLSLIHI